MTTQPAEMPTKEEGAPGAVPGASTSATPRFPGVFSCGPERCSVSSAKPVPFGPGVRGADASRPRVGDELWVRLLDGHHPTWRRARLQAWDADADGRAGEVLVVDLSGLGSLAWVPYRAGRWLPGECSPPVEVDATPDPVELARALGVTPVHAGALGNCLRDVLTEVLLNDRPLGAAIRAAESRARSILSAELVGVLTALEDEWDEWQDRGDVDPVTAAKAAELWGESTCRVLRALGVAL